MESLETLTTLDNNRTQTLSTMCLIPCKSLDHSRVMYKHHLINGEGQFLTLTIIIQAN